MWLRISDVKNIKLYNMAAYLDEKRILDNGIKIIRLINNLIKTCFIFILCCFSCQISEFEMVLRGVGMG